MIKYNATRLKEIILRDSCKIDLQLSESEKLSRDSKIPFICSCGESYIRTFRIINESVGAFCKNCVSKNRTIKKREELSQEKLDLLNKISSRDKCIINTDLIDFSSISRESTLTFICNCGVTEEKVFRYMSEKGGGFCKNCTKNNKTHKMKNTKIQQGSNYDNNTYKIEAFNIHGTQYNYDNLNVLENPIKIQCKKHGLFLQDRFVHLSKIKIHGCPECGKDIVKYKAHFRKCMDVIIGYIKLIKDTKIKLILQQYNCNNIKIVKINKRNYYDFVCTHGFENNIRMDHFSDKYNPCPLTCRSQYFDKHKCVDGLYNKLYKNNNEYEGIYKLFENLKNITNNEKSQKHIDCLRIICKNRKIKNIYGINIQELLDKLILDTNLKKIQRWYRNIINIRGNKKIKKNEILEQYHKIIVIKNYKKIDDGYYLSPDGDVYNIKTNHFLKSTIRNGYKIIRINNKHYTIHRLVCEKFNEIPLDNSYKVDHIDRNRLNNSYTNLRWVSDKDNANNRKYKESNIEIIQYNINKKFIKKWKNIKEIKENTSFNINAITLNCNNHHNTSQGFIWSYTQEYINKQILKKADDSEIINLGTINNIDLSNYWISKDGQKIYDKNKIEMTFIIEDGYKRLILNKKRFPHHKIVNVIFNNGKYDDIVDHKNGNRSDNRSNNLESVNQTENMERAQGVSVVQICKNTGYVLNTFRSLNDAGRFFHKKSGAAVGKAIKNKTETYGYKWEIIANYKERTENGRKKDVISDNNYEHNKTLYKYICCQIDPNTNKIINEYKNYIDAGKALGKKYAGSHIGECCRKNNNAVSYGFIWKLKINCVST